jgi:hypothetical protein
VRQVMMAIHLAQMKVAKFTMTMAKVIWRMKMSKMIIATKIMSKVIAVVNFILFFPFS